MKRGKKLILLLAVFGIIICGYVITHNISKKTQVEAAITVAALNKDDIQSLRWVDKNSNLTLERSGDIWKYKDDPDKFPLDPSVPQTMLTALEKVTASRQITETGTLSEYGLDQPTLTIVAVTKDGKEHRFTIGNQNSVTYQYYLMCDDDSSKIWMTDQNLSKAFGYSLNDMAKKEELPSFGTVRGLSVSGENTQFSMTYVDDSSSIFYNKEYHWFVDQGGKELAADTDKATALNEKVTGLAWDSCVNYNATDDMMEKFGLGASATKVNLKYTAAQATAAGETKSADTTSTEVNNFSLLIGKQTDSGRYAALEGSHMVYLISEDTASSLVSASYSSVHPTYLCQMDWTTVKYLDVWTKGQLNTISFDGTKDVQVKTETTDKSGKPVTGTKTETVNAFTSKGRDLDTDKVEILLSSIYSLKVVNEAVQVLGQQKEAALVFYRNTDNLPQLTLNIYSFNDSQCLVEFQGEMLLISRGDLNTLIQQAKDVFGS